jgi:hypothetical protein
VVEVRQVQELSDFPVDVVPRGISDRLQEIGYGRKQQGQP